LFYKPGIRIYRSNSVVDPDGKIYYQVRVQDVSSFFNESSYAPEAIFIAFFEGFNFNACLHTYSWVFLAYF